MRAFRSLSPECNESKALKAGLVNTEKLVNNHVRDTPKRPNEPYSCNDADMQWSFAFILICALLVLAIKYANQSCLQRERDKTQEIQETFNYYIEETVAKDGSLNRKKAAIEAKLEEGKEMSRQITDQVDELMRMKQQMQAARERSRNRATSGDSRSGSAATSTSSST